MREKESKIIKIKDSGRNKVYFNYLTQKNWEPMYDPDGIIFGWRKKGANPLNIVSVQRAVKLEMGKSMAPQKNKKLINFAQYKK